LKFLIKKNYNFI